MSRRILYSGFKWKQHHELSGYQQVVPKGQPYIDGGKLPFGAAAFRSVKNRVNLFITDVVTAVAGLRYDCVFCFYPEHSVYVSPFILRLAGVKVVYAVHIDERYWFDPTNSPFMRLKQWQARFVDHFIVLSRVQMPHFQKRFGSRVTFIPHGIWCTMDLPVTTVSTSKILVIGDSYRDYDLLASAAAAFLERHPEATFHLVGVDRERVAANGKLANMTVHPRLANSDYYQLIADCEFIYLPLTYAAANNALLEGMSLGVPVVCNDLEGVLDYLPGTDYVVSSVTELEAFYVRHVAMTKAERLAEQARLREYCRDNFDWSVVQNKVIALCEQL